MAEVFINCGGVLKYVSGLATDIRFVQEPSESSQMPLTAIGNGRPSKGSMTSREPWCTPHTGMTISTSPGRRSQ